MNSFEKHGIAHLSASSINTWMAAPSLWVLEKLLGHRSVMGCSAHRGTSAEDGISAALFNPAMEEAEAVEIALTKYQGLTALSTDPKREVERGVIPGMVRQGLTLREHGVPIRPNGFQHKIEINLPGLSVPVIGYLDWLYADEIIDLKTTLRVPSSISDPHCRQASIYKSAHMDKRVRFFYASDKKAEKHTLTREQYDVAMRETTGAALRLQRFLALSDDAAELAAIVPHTTDSFYFNDPSTKAKALEVFGY